ncbi:MAG: glycosyltransferase family 4 protein [Actinomycetota bacterium]|nr:glycosyltransferase family 4 protein [Actinomycetota bacterium]
MSRTLVLTNDFPTRWGGIETFVRSLCDGFDPAALTVYTSAMPGAQEYDATLPFAVHRDPTSMLLPTPAVSRRVTRVLRESGSDRVVFGASAPLGLLAPALRAAGAERLVGLTHGHEVWWARSPGTRQALRRIGEGTDTLTYVSDWCRDRIAPALSPAAAARMARLSPGADVDRFWPGCGGAEIRSELGLAADEPVAVCAARLIPRKGQDTLVAAWPRVLESVPAARLLLIGDGPYRRRLERAAAPLGDRVLFAGDVHPRVPAYLDAGDVFVMPCRTRRASLEAEAFGIVFLEAAACGLPVVVGGSGGAPETVAEGSTGYVVPPRDIEALAGRIAGLLNDPDRARAMGAAGRERVTRAWTWSHAQQRLHRLLA